MLIKKMVRWMVVTSLVLSIAGCQAKYFNHHKAVNRTDYDHIQSDLQEYLDRIIKKRNMRGGMSIGIKLSDGPVIAVSTGYANVEKKELYTEQTPILIAGISKVFTSVMVLQLVEEGKLSLDDTLDTWLSDQLHADHITLRMLLSHTSGFKDYLKHPNLQLQDEYEPIELIHLANDLGFNEFNKGYYTTTNYIVLGLILEEVTGHSWAEELHSRIIVPLNLTQTYYAGEPGVMDTILAANYTKKGTNANVSETIHPSVGWAAGGTVSNIPDLLSFFEALLDGTLLHNRSILSHAMTPIVKAEPDTKIHQYASFSLCLHQYKLNDIMLLGHYGSFGFHSHMLYDPTLQLIYIDTSNSMNAEEGFEDVEIIIRYLRKLKK